MNPPYGKIKLNPAVKSNLSMPRPAGPVIGPPKRRNTENSLGFGRQSDNLTRGFNSLRPRLKP